MLMNKLIGVKFKNNPKIYDFLKLEEEIEIGDQVLVDTSFGIELATVIYIDKKITKPDQESQFKTILRKVTAKDFERQKLLAKDKARFEKIFKNCVTKHSLSMKLVGIECSFDKQVIFLFSADSRIDFRDLVKDLARILKKPIKLKQIGPRDEARYLGDYGQCGRQICCREFLGNMASITMDMARDQNLSYRGSAKISGLCGRLMCCLAFEDQFYKEMLKNLPKIGEKIKTKNGVGKIINIDALGKKIEAELSDGSKIEVSL